MKLTKGIVELIGALIGDGYIYQKNHKYQRGLVGNPATDKKYLETLKQLILEEWKKNVKIKLRSKAIRIVFDSKEIYCNWDLARYSIRGIVDTDGSVFVSKKPRIENYPCIEITTTSKSLIDQLRNLLNERGFRVTFRLEKRIK